jgi:hypothetical protein
LSAVLADRAIPLPNVHSGRNAIFAINSERNRPHIFIEILGKDQTWKVIHCMADTGNDINLFNKPEADRLGIDLEKEGRPFKVGGISGDPVTFYMCDIVMKIKDTLPFKARAGFGELRDNLLGREGVFSRYDIVFSPDSVTFWERRHAEKMAAYAGRYSYR